MLSLLMCMYGFVQSCIQRKLERDFVQNGEAPPTTDEVPDEGEEENEEEEIDEIATVSGICSTAAAKLLPPLSQPILYPFLFGISLPILYILNLPKIVKFYII